jgi:carbonic anhydrase/acetyltransferase-like protein (isoleucine patch superfamily)
MVHAVGDAVPRIDATAFVHPAAVIMGDVEVGPYSSIWPGAVLRGDFARIRVGARTSIQDNVVIHADGDGTHIGDRCVVGHLAFIEEAVIGNGCLVSAGSRILNGARMHDGSVAAAGAVVLGRTEVPTGMRAQGVPATIVAGGRPSREQVEAGAEQYVAMAAQVAASLAAAGLLG